MKSYTDLEQSKKLAKILPIESADMYWWYSGKRYYIEAIDDGDFNEKGDIRAWSLAALLNVMKESELIGSPEGTWLNRVWYKGFPISRGGYNNPVDACVAMIIKLHEQNLL